MSQQQQQKIGRAGDGVSLKHLHMTSIELPPLHSRFPMTLPPEVESVREECDSWGLSLLGPSASVAEREAYLSSRLYLVGAVLFPHTSSRRRLELLTKLNIFGFVFDDVMEHAEPMEAAGLMRAMAPALLKKHGSAGASVASHPSTAAPPMSPAELRMAVLAERYRTEVWEEMCRDMTPSFEARVEKDMHDFFRASAQDQYSSAGHRSVDDCVAFRMSVAGVNAYLSLLEYSLDVDIGDQLTSIPLMALFKQCVLKHGIMVNDLLSFPKELVQDGGYARGTVGALIKAVAGNSSTEAVDLQGIINKLWDTIQEEEVRIAGLVDEIKAQFPASSDLVKVVDSLCTFLSTNMYWYTVSSRYGSHRAKFFHSKPTQLEYSPTIVTLNLNPSFQITMESLLH